MNREKMIKELTEYELRWLTDNFNESFLDGCVEFFSKGGFNTASPEQLEKLYESRFGDA